MKKLIKIILLCVTSTYLCTVNADVTAPAQTLGELIEDFKSYKTTNVNFHAGDLYEHSLWVAITINSWFQAKEEWTLGLDKHDQKIVTLAGLLHDVGKAGDLEFSFYTKPPHDTKGQNYILGKETYILSNHETFNFDALFKALKLSDTDVKIISILVGAHNEFGILLKNSTNPDAKTCEQFAQKLIPYLEKAEYKFPINAKLINMAILVTAADVRGSQVFENKHPFNIFGFTINKSPTSVHKEAENKFLSLGYDSRGKKYRALIVK